MFAAQESKLIQTFKDGQFHDKTQPFPKLKLVLKYKTI